MALLWRQWCQERRSPLGVNTIKQTCHWLHPNWLFVLAPGPQNWSIPSSPTVTKILSRSNKHYARFFKQRSFLFRPWEFKCSTGKSRKMDQARFLIRLLTAEKAISGEYQNWSTQICTRYKKLRTNANWYLSEIKKHFQLCNPSYTDIVEPDDRDKNLRVPNHSSMSEYIKKFFPGLESTPSIVETCMYTVRLHNIMK